MRSNRLVDDITTALRRADQSAYKMLHAELIKSNWQLGKILTEADAVDSLSSADLQQLSLELSELYGIDIKATDLQLYMQFYRQHPILDKLSMELLWTHYLLLLPVKDDLARAFYQWQAAKEQWTIAQLQEYISLNLFEKFKQERRENREFTKPRSAAPARADGLHTSDIHLHNFLMRFQKQSSTT